MPTLTLTAATWAKQQPVQSDTLPEADKAWMEAGAYPCLAYDDAPGDHVLVTLDPAKVDLAALHPSERNTWNFFKGHCEIEGNLPENQPADRALPADVPRGRMVDIPGYGRVGLLDKISGCLNFTWDEAVKGGSRIPATPAITRNIISIAQSLDDVRAMLGHQPITVTSWYRPPAINRAVGGASQSTHLLGHAVDFQHAKLRPKAIYDRLDPWWGSRGGLAWCDRPGRSFVHLDLRGYRARWLY